MEAPKDKVSLKTNKNLLALLSLLSAYKRGVSVNILLALTNTVLSLMVPYSISKGINGYMHSNSSLKPIIIELTFIATGIFVFSTLQIFAQARVSTRIAYDLRNRLTEKIALQEYASFRNIAPGKLLANFTTDIASVAKFISQAGPSFVSSVLLIFGASISMCLISPKLASMIFMLALALYGIFFLVLRKVRPLFEESHSEIYKINRIIDETILGAMLVRILNSQAEERGKMLEVNTASKHLGLRISGLLAKIPPSITISANIAIFLVTLFGGHYVINGKIGLGEFMAFNTYLAILIFPVSILGLISSSAVQAGTSYQRVIEILNLEDKPVKGALPVSSSGDIVLNKIHVAHGKKIILKDISFTAKAGTRTAIIGPSGAGKTQLFYLLMGLVDPYQGQVIYAGNNIRAYDPIALHGKFGLVFQDSIVFNLSLRENIAFNSDVKDRDLELAISTAELKEFIDALPEKLDTVVTERGTNLSGGQKQRLMLARALALNPSVLLLDDFTARLDIATEKKILQSVRANYPDTTIISATQKIAAIEDYDQIILLMDGEILAIGTHANLLRISPEYVQIYDSQRSTNDHAIYA